MKYISDYNSTELKNKLNDLIKLRSEDKFSSHFQNVISNRTNTISGKIKEKNFVIWHYKYFWSGMFYSVIDGKISDNGETYFIELRTKLNSFGFILISIISCVLGKVILSGIVLQENNSYKFVVLRLLVGIVLFLLFQSVPLLTYRSSKKETVEMLTKKLKLRKNVC